MLCANRPEGFGPHSTLSTPLPTTCFIDTILIPLPVWLSLFLLAPLIFLSIRHRNANYNLSSTHTHTRTPILRTCLSSTTTAIYYLLITANILMAILEIVRLSLLHYGIALLPFTFVGLVLGATLHFTDGVQGRVRGWQWVNYLLWGGGVVMSVIKVVGLMKEGMDGRKGSKYPVADQVTDVAVMAGVYVVIGVLEVVLGVWRRKSRRSVPKVDGEEQFRNLRSL